MPRLFRSLRSLSAALLLVALVTGCAVNRQSANVTEGEDITQFKNFYVVKFVDDERGVNRMIQDELIAMGYDASTGPEGAAPEAVDAVVTYIDKWFWDITMYMLELTITLRDPEDDYPLAIGNSYHTSLTRLSPEEMVQEVLTNIMVGPPAAGS
jgi:hypothetical protein